uniref:Uncharacterized protein n=1 Tax=Timema cristinae TaxID=61476 RepID=A0A7R9DH20_TIMCR|nr:unnamed protein product [Timema cristinae]
MCNKTQRTWREWIKFGEHSRITKGGDTRNNIIFYNKLQTTGMFCKAIEGRGPFISDKIIKASGKNIQRKEMAEYPSWPNKWRGSRCHQQVVLVSDGGLMDGLILILFSLSFNMKTLVLFLIVLSIAACLCTALPVNKPSIESVVVLRETRSPRPDDKKKSKGKFGVDVYEEDRVGVVGKVQGQGTVWESNNGRSKVEAHGEWSKVFDGPERSKPHHKSGISFSHDFGDK